MRGGASGHRSSTRPVPRMRQACESVVVSIPALLVAIVVGCAVIAVVARPVSTFARRYVSNLERAEAPTASSSPGGITTEPGTFRAQWLLRPASQAFWPPSCAG